MAKARRKADATERLSEQQKDILLWAYRYEPEPPRAGETVTFAPTSLYVSGDGLPVYRKPPSSVFVPWRSTSFLGRKPTPSERANLPVSLKRLDERGLLKRYNLTFSNGAVNRMTLLEGEHDRARTTHLQLTAEGISLAEALASENAKADENQARKLELAEYREGLYFARALVDRERQRERVRLGIVSSDLLERAEKLVANLAEGELYEKISLASYALAKVFEELEKELKGQHESSK